MKPYLPGILLLLCGAAQSAGISDPTQFMFVGDRDEKIIDVISLNDAERVQRIETSIQPDHIIATPFAPILMYAGIDARQIVFYDLEKMQETATIDLPVVPRHVVLDTSGARIGVSDDIDGGFVLLNAYKRAIEFVIDAFPPATDVLFDPNDVDIYYSNEATGSIGLLDTNTLETYEVSVADDADVELSAPSRSLDGRYIYVSNITDGVVYSLNAYSQVIFKSFEMSGIPARPYTTPQGTFLYMMDEDSGDFTSIEQSRFTEYVATTFVPGVDLVAVGRFDRMNVLLSTKHKHWYLFDNMKKDIVAQGVFHGTPIGVLGSADGKLAYVAFADVAEVAVVDLEGFSVDYVEATNNGSGAFTIGLSNNVCH